MIACGFDKKSLLHIKVGEILSVKKGVLKSLQAFQNPLNYK